MPIYEARGFSNTLHCYRGKLEPFEYIARFKPLIVQEGVSVDEYKRNHAPYCISGDITANLHGTYKRNNTSLVYRDLIFLDYDDIPTTAEGFKKLVWQALKSYSYILYQTIKHTAQKPRYRLVVKPNHKMDEISYKGTIKEIAEKIGLPFDLSSLTWSQLQGLPVTRYSSKEFDRVVNYGRPYPVKLGKEVKREVTQPYQPKSKTITMRVLDTLLNGYGEEGGRNMSATRFIGLLLSKYVNCDINTAYELAEVANSVTTQPLAQHELDTIFKSIAKAEIRKRGGNY